MKTGYPFLAISKKHNLDYADVLMAADYGRFLGITPRTERAQTHYKAFMAMPDEAMKDIIRASNEFVRMQDGDLFWQNGHEIRT